MTECYLDTTSIALSSTYMVYSQNYDWLSRRIIRVMGKYVYTHERNKQLMWYSVTVKRISYPHNMLLDKANEAEYRIYVSVNLVINGSDYGLMLNRHWALFESLIV